MTITLSIVWGLFALLWTLDALRLRKRAEALAVLAPSDAPAAPNHVFFVRPGVVLDEATKRAASTWAREKGIEVLDLVAPGMTMWRAQALLQTVDPAKYREDRLARGRTAGDALLVDMVLLARLGRSIQPPRDTVAFLDLAQVLKRYASKSSDLAIAPSLRTTGVPLRERRRVVRMLFGDLAIPFLTVQTLLLVAGPALANVAGLIALAAYHLQPLLAMAGTKLRPAHALPYALFRVPIELASVFGPAAPDVAPDPEAERRTYAELLARGLHPFFEPRRDDCPICASRALGRAFEVGDVYQWKPGRFALEKCRDCGHLFQNPRLSVEGLNFYYKDFYDGLGEERLESMFAWEKHSYVARANMVGSVRPPSRWLDVGAGHGHFCGILRDVWPKGRFDGLDLSESIEDAVRRGWVDHGYRGLFPDLAPTLAEDAEPYDVVSMSHYLEHTRDPRAEIEAAAKVLPSGGLLLIEVPDPECRFGRLFGKFWMPWFQPQHQHLLTAKNLERLLRENAFEPIVWHRGEAHQPSDFLFVTHTVLSQIAPPVNLPWRAPSSRATRIWNKIVWGSTFPILGLAWLADQLAAPFLRRPGFSNTYRVLARRTA